MITDEDLAKLKRDIYRAPNGPQIEEMIDELILRRATTLTLDDLCHISARLKHGPGGTGRDGPCDNDCTKCKIEKMLEAVR